MKIAYTQPNYQMSAANQGAIKKRQDSSIESKKHLTSSESVSQALRDAKKELNEMIDIDLDKVVSLKTAIREGRINVDPETLAIAMFKYHQR